MMVRSNSAFSLVEEDGFHDFTEYLNPNFKRISRYILRRNIDVVYRSLETQVKTLLSNHVNAEDARISLTLDTWTSSMMVPYLGITAHFITGDWKFKSMLLGFSPLRGAHTAVALADETVKILDHYSITKSIQSITVDNAAVMTKMVTNLQNSLPGFASKTGHIRCMAHIINLAAQQLLKHLKVGAQEEVFGLIGNEIPAGGNSHADIFMRARKIIAKIRFSTYLTEHFNGQIKLKSLPQQRLVLDSKTRYVYLTFGDI